VTTVDPGSEDVNQNRVFGNSMYVAPEMLSGDENAPNPRCDVYCLGAVLYVALTGEPLFSGSSAFQLLKRILQESPKPPRRIVRSIPASLEAICLKAIAKDPGQRYATAGEMAAALREFLKPRRRAGFWKSGA
jgi:eukaryotic-like serine/threonine-protein kinase